MESPVIGRIGIVNIDVQKGWEPIAVDRGRDQNLRVSNQDLSWATWLYRTCRSEHRPKKVHLSFHVLDDHARGYRVVWLAADSSTP